MRSLRGSPWAMAAISDSTNRPSVWRQVGNARQRLHHREVGQRRVAGDLAASSSALARPSPSATTYCDRPTLQAFVGVEDAAGEHHVGHAGHADQARDARRAAAADEDAALAFGQAVVGAALGHADVAAAASSSPPPTTAPCSTATTGTRPNWIASNAACHMRECSTPVATSRSASSDRSSPAQKCVAVAAEHDARARPRAG